MWRPSFTVFKKLVTPSIKDNVNLTRIMFSTKSRLPRSTAKLTLVSASIGIFLGAGYSGYTHYKINSKKPSVAEKKEEYAFLKEAPQYKPQYRVSKIKI